MLIICTVNGKKIKKVRITYTSKLLRINAVVIRDGGFEGVK
jgi:hypothetical protein